jgi:MlaD protein
MRKLSTIIFLVFLAALVWLAARWFVHRGELAVTVVLPTAGELRRGDPVVENGVEIGRVSAIAPLDGQDAISIRVARDHRRSIVSDSLFEVSGTAPHARLEVNNTIAVGSPVADGAILRPSDDKVTRWLAKHGSSVAPLIAGLKEKADRIIDAHSADDLDRELAEWKAKVPEWKQEGEKTLDQHLQNIRQQVAKAEADLKKGGKSDQAARLRKKFDAWWKDVTK